MKQAELFQWFHMHPEIGFTEHESTDKIRETLTAAGVEVLPSELKTGLVAVVRGKRPGKTVCFRADIDALPITEETELPYASLHPGVMHACGHDFHTVSAISAAIRLQERRESLAGTVYFVFEPAEELIDGAKTVLRTGLVRDVSRFFGIHSDPSLPVGQIGVHEGGVMSAFDRFEIEVKGVGTHAATPHLGKNPIPVLVSLIGQLQTLAAASISNARRYVLSLTRLSAGTTWNVIPERASCVGTIRTLDEADRATLRASITHIVSHFGELTGTEVTLDWVEGSPCVRNDASLCALSRTVAEKNGLQAVDFVPELLSDDFSYFTTDTPGASGAYLKVGTGIGSPLHHPRFQVDLSVLEPTAAFLADLLQAATE